MEQQKAVKCAIYTRKSTGKGLDVALTSPQAQRASAENYIKSHETQGWVALSTAYDDAAYSGENMNRPGFQRLMRDIEGGLVDSVVVYKMDRIGRNVRDFLDLVEFFENRKIKYVSITENFDTSTPIGRAVITILMAVAQYQREDTAERVVHKQKIMAERGMRISGAPIIGYDIKDKMWVPNESERPHALKMFSTYLETKSLIKTVRWLNEHGYRTKRWVSSKGTQRGGKPFTKSTLSQLLHNPVYTGSIRYKKETYRGKHQGIVPQNLFDEVQKVLAANTEDHDSVNSGQADLWLKGKIRCGICGSSMVPAWSWAKGKKFLYYECHKTRTYGRAVCPAGRISAVEIHRTLLERIQFMGRNPSRVRDIMEEVKKRIKIDTASYENDSAQLGRELAQLEKEGLGLTRAIANGLDQNIGFVSLRLKEIEAGRQKLAMEKARVDQQAKTQAALLPSYEAVQAALARFPKLMMNAATLTERKDMADLLIDSVVYNEPKGQIIVRLWAIADMPSTTITVVGFRKGYNTPHHLGRVSKPAYQAAPEPSAPNPLNAAEPFRETPRLELKSWGRADAEEP